MLRNSSRGFTMIELFSVLVIVGIMVCYALPQWSGIPSVGRVDALRSVAATMQSNVAAARGAWMVRGGLDSVMLNGRVVPMIPAVAASDTAPTEAGMFVLLGCGNAAPANGVTVLCEAMPRYYARVTESDYLVLWPMSNGDHPYGSLACAIEYSRRYQANAGSADDLDRIRIRAKC